MKGLKKYSIWLIGIFFLLFVLVSWVLSYYYITNNYEKSEWGIIGDLFGSVNALFSGFAFVGLIITILLQSRELKEQREVLTDQKEELRLTNEIYKTQTRLTKIQQFENTFYNIINQIEINYSDDKFRDLVYYVSNTVEERIYTPEDKFKGYESYKFLKDESRYHITFEYLIEACYLKTLIKLINLNKERGVIEDTVIYKDIIKNKISQHTFNLIISCCYIPNFISDDFNFHFFKLFSSEDYRYNFKFNKENITSVTESIQRIELKLQEFKRQNQNKP